MTDLVSKTTDGITDLVESGVDTLQSKTLYYGVAGVAAAAIAVCSIESLSLLCVEPEMSRK